MFILFESIRSAFLSIRAHGFRSILTTVSITIGVATVIAMVSIIQGLSFFNNQQFEGLGTNSLIIQSFTSVEDRLQGRVNRITPDDLELISRRIDGIVSITPMLQGGGIGQVRYQDQTMPTQVLGSTYTYQSVQQLFIRTGRFISHSDNQTRRRVAVIGEDLRVDLELPEDPTGEFIEVNGEWLRIIGLTEVRGQIFGESQDNYAVIPFNTMQSLIGNQVIPNIVILLRIADVANLEQITERISLLLRDAHGLQAGDDDDFQIQSSAQLADTINSILGYVTLVMGGIVGISLLVGGIGIMNIMLVSVTERTREIGICKAVGAQRKQILLQFLFESMFQCLLGGLIGLVLGYGLGAAIAYFIGSPEAVVPLWAALLAVSFSAFIGVLFGIMPAAKAANLDPIEALRYE